MRPSYGKRYDIASGSNLGLVLRISSGGQVPQWIRSLDYVYDSRDYGTREYLIRGGATGPVLPGGWHTNTTEDEYEGMVTEEEIIEAERDIPE